MPTGPFYAGQYSAAVIALPATDSLGNPVEYGWVELAGTVVVVQNDVVTYWPDTNVFFQGGMVSLDARNYTDGLDVPFTITILPASPVISFTTTPGNAFPGTENQVVVIASNEPVQITFDGSGTVSTNSLPVSETWYEGTNCLLASGQSGYVWETPGSHTIMMIATDGTCTNAGSQTIEILTPDGAITNLENSFSTIVVSQKVRRDMLRILSKAEKWATEGKPKRARIELFDFQKKLQSHHNPVSPVISTNLVTAAQEIMDKL